MHQFSGVTELIHDSLGHADCLGSGYIMRRAALEEIGGFPVESLSEDVCCSAKMLGAGWKTCFIPESLQHGSVPESYNAHVKQRTRWVCAIMSSEMRRNTDIQPSSLWATSRLRLCSSFASLAPLANT
jgi:hypothetical protein